MKVLLSTNHYGRMPGGALAMTEMTHRLLAAAGHEVVPFAIKEEKAHPSEWQEYWPSPADLRDQLIPVGDELETPYSFAARRKLLRLLDVAQPDVAHLHNVYGKITLSVVDALRERRVPIVLTLHEYRSICANGWLGTHDGVCHRCVGGSTLNAVRHRCVDGSFSKSAIAAAELMINRRRRQFDKIDLMLSPSEFLRDEVVGGGLDGTRIRIVRNPAERAPAPNRALAWPPRFVFFARLAQSKGIDVLLNASKLLEGEAEVVVFGAGPLEEHIVRRIERERLPVTFRGYADRQTISRELAACIASLLPSLWYENAPMAILEAGAQGVATIGSSLGAIAEMTDDGSTGVLVPPGDAPALAAAMRELVRDPARALELGRRAWDLVGERHDPTTYVENVVGCYEEVAARPAQIRVNV